MKRLESIIKTGLLLAIFIVAGAGGAIDRYDSIIVRTILDKIGWTDLPVDSVVGTGKSVSLSSIQPMRVTTLNLACRNCLKPALELPLEISQLPELVSLSLKGNALTGLPDTVATLHKLVRLDLSSNKIRQLPSAIKGLPLQVLVVNHNPLGKLPDWISEISTLQSASFAGDSLTSLPAAFSKLSGLTMLNLDSNRLATLPREITALTALKISVNGNRLCSIDTAIARWLDQAHIGIDWRTAQQCEMTITSIITEAVTGTVVHVGSAATEKVTAACQPLQLTPVENASLPCVKMWQIVKAVAVRFNACFTPADSNFFLVTFSWGDVVDPVPSASEISIYYVQDGVCRYLGGAVDSVNKTISVKASREGTYLLTINPSTSAHPTVSPSCSAVGEVRLAMNRNLLEASFFLRRSSAVLLQLFTLDGKQVYKSASQAEAGAVTLYWKPNAFRTTGRRLIAHLQTDEFTVIRTLQVF